MIFGHGYLHGELNTSQHICTAKRIDWTKMAVEGKSGSDQHKLYCITVSFTINFG